MKKHEIETLRGKNQIDSVKIVRSPSDDDEVCSYASLDTAVAELDALGFARAEVLF